MAHNTRIRPGTTIAAASGGVALPQATINVASTAGPPAFASTGSIAVATTAGVQTVTYTGTTGTTFTGCTGGTGTMAVGGMVSDTWQNITAAELQTLSTRCIQAVNAGDGGCWAPTSQIVIGGQGIYCTGLLTIARGGQLITGSSPYTILLADNDWPVIDPVGNTLYATQTVVMPCTLARGEKTYAWHVRREDGGLQAWAPMFDASDGFGMRVSRAFMHLRSHDASTLTSLKVTFRVGTPHTGLPSGMPQVRVMRVDSSGNSVPCTSVASGADANGYVSFPKANSPSAWYNAGAAQTFTLPIDQNNVISLAQYDYIVELVDEQGLNGYPWQLTFMQPCRLLLNGSSLPTPSGNINGDGVLFLDNDRIAAINQYEPSQNGIWIAKAQSGGPWYRATDLNQSSQFTQGFVIPVTSGKTFSNVYVQCLSTITSWSRGTSPDYIKNWAKNTPVPANGPMLPTPSHATGLWYSSASGGTTAAVSEPQWPTGVGQQIMDNTVTWTCQGTAPGAMQFVGKPDALNPQEGTGFIAHGTIWHSVTPTFSNIPDFRPQ